MSVWEKMALRVEREYGAHVDWDERFFECPECGEPIYEDDWAAKDFDNGTTCPVCGNGI